MPKHVMRPLISAVPAPKPWGPYLRQLVEEDLPELVALEELCYDDFLAWTLKDFGPTSAIISMPSTGC